MAASVANFKHLILLMVGSKTPAFLLSRTTPLTKSKPILKKQNNLLNAYAALKYKRLRDLHLEIQK